MSSKKLNMNGKQWIKNSISIWSDIKKSAEERQVDHPAIFPKMLPERLMQCFSHENDKILDPFAGSGSTLIAAKNMERYSLGIELSEKFKELYLSRPDRNTLFQDSEYEPEYINADSNDLLKHVDKEEIDLTITSPPYWDILNRNRTADKKNSRNYSDSNIDLGNIESYEKFINSLKNIFEKVYKATKKGGYCIVVVMDIRKKDKFFPFHMDLTTMMQEIKFELDDIIIWDRRAEYNNLRPLGYPYVFRVNKTHEFIMIYKKR